MPKTELISISDGASVALLSPAFGGGLVSWSVEGQDILRRADSAGLAADDPRCLAAFPLVPFSNRIGYARFDWDQRQIDLIPNVRPEPHALHGVGWQKDWTILEKSDRQVTIALNHVGDAYWPWPFVATQIIRIGKGTLELELRATNLADQSAPLAFGYHPFFDSAGASLSFAAAHVLMVGDDALPTTAVVPVGQFDFSSGGAVAGRTVDHCYAGWDGRARIFWAGRPHALEIVTDLGAAVVYIPTDENFFCFEPVPHTNNALNCAGALAPMPIIAPGRQFATTVLFSAVSPAT